MFVGYVETQTRFCHDIHVLIATDYINGLCYFDRRMGRDSIRQFSYLADLTVLDVESKDLLGFCVWIGLSASAYQNCVISINEMIGAVLSDVSLFKGQLVSSCLKFIVRVIELEEITAIGLYVDQVLVIDAWFTLGNLEG